MKKLKYITTNDGKVWFNLGVGLNANTKNIHITYCNFPVQQRGIYDMQFLAKENNWRFGRENSTGGGNNKLYVMFVSGIHYYLDDLVCDGGTVDISTTEFKYNGTTILSYSHTFNSNGNDVFLFNNKNVTNGDYLLSGSCGEIIITNTNDEVVADFIPVIDDNGVVCMYESVSDTYRYNLGTGTPIAGPSAFGPETDEVTLAAMSTSYAIDLITETDWTATTTSDWFTLSATAGTSADTAITITTTINDGIERTGNVVFSNAEDSVTLQVTQKAGMIMWNKTLKRGANTVAKMYRSGVPTYRKMGYKPQLSTDVSSLTYAATGGTNTITVSSDANWTYQTSADWLTITRTGDTLNVTASEFVSEDNSRSTTITLTADNGILSNTLTIPVAQYKVHYVSFIRTQEAAASTFDYLKRIDTGIEPTTATTMRIVFRGTGYGSDRIIGYCPKEIGNDDNKDWRYFTIWENKNTIDMNAARAYTANGTGYLTNNTVYDVTIGNNYLYNNLTQEMVVTSTTQTSIAAPSGTKIYFDCRQNWVQLVQIKQGDTLVFDGHAAIDNGVIGLYDSVTGQMVTNTDLTLTYEE